MGTDGSLKLPDHFGYNVSSQPDQVTKGDAVLGMNSKDTCFVMENDSYSPPEITCLATQKKHTQPIHMFMT